MKIKTSDLTGAALDWAVAKAGGLLEQTIMIGTQSCEKVVLDTHGPVDMRSGTYFRPSIDWSQAGPIIERECISLRFVQTGPREIEVEAELWPDYSKSCSGRATGPTAMIAAMRCLVDSKLGKEVDVPDELLRSTS